MDKSTSSEKEPDKIKWGLLGKYLGGLVLIYVIIAAFIPLSDSEEYPRCHYLRPCRTSERYKYPVCERYPSRILFFKRINLVHRLNTDTIQRDKDEKERRHMYCGQL